MFCCFENIVNKYKIDLLLNLSEKLTRIYFDVSMTSCHPYQEIDKNLHLQIYINKQKTIVIVLGQ